jgi:hypothetical protein
VPLRRLSLSGWTGKLSNTIINRRWFIKKV